MEKMGCNPSYAVVQARSRGGDVRRSGFTAAALAGASFHRHQPLPSLPSLSTCHCHLLLSCANGLPWD